MGLTIFVGLLARVAQEEDLEGFAFSRAPYDQLNDLLQSVGESAHQEPLTLAADQYFEAQMWGYSGLHTVRRLAAYHALKGGLPPEGADTQAASTDEVLDKFYQAHGRYLVSPSQGWLERLTGPKRVKPRYQHLIWHSDCEGFYLPRPFADVILDKAEPEREGLGGMVGSSVQLLEECRELARTLSLPEDMDPESGEMLDAAESPTADGPLWRRYGVESFCLTQLIRGCKASLQYEAALVFG